MIRINSILFIGNLTPLNFIIAHTLSGKKSPWSRDLELRQGVSKCSVPESVVFIILAAIKSNSDVWWWKSRQNPYWKFLFNGISISIPSYLSLTPFSFRHGSEWIFTFYVNWFRLSFSRKMFRAMMKSFLRLSKAICQRIIAILLQFKHKSAELGCGWIRFNDKKLVVCNF